MKYISRHGGERAGTAVPPDGAAVAASRPHRHALLPALFLLSVLGGMTDAAAETPAERGRYLAVAANCAACHSTRSGAPMAGGVAFETDFGVIHSTNITPHPERGIGKWTAAQFRTAMRRGIGPGGKRFYPVFPYTHFTRLTDSDIDALYAHLRSIPPSAQPPTPNSVRFPFNRRELLAVWNLLFLREGPLQPETSRGPEWNRGRYLVEALAHCSACHTPRNALGAERSSMAMTGAAYLDEVAPGIVRRWQSANLTRHATGLSGWTTDDFVAYLQRGGNRHLSINGPMRKVVMDGTRHLQPSDIRSMATYLRSLPANAQSPARPATPAERRRGNRIYTVRCAKCHLPFGEGRAESGPALAGNPTVQASHPSSLINIILHGPQRPKPPVPAAWREMRAYREVLSDRDVADLASFLRNAWGNEGGAVAIRQVTDQR